MKALVYYEVGDVRMEERPVPKPKDGEILLKVEACAICGTDVRIINSGHKAVQPPRIIGHEISGTVAEIGENVDGFLIGDKVVVVTPVGCGHCKFCRADMQNMCKIVSKDVHSLGYYCDGGFAEYMLIPKEAVDNNNLIKFDVDIPHSETALVEPLSCVINSHQFLNIKENDVIAVFGAGPIGCMHGLLSKASGAAKVVFIDVLHSRLNMAKDVGAGDIFVNSEKENLIEIIKKETMGDGVDVAITACPSHSAQEQALEITGIRGRISFFGGLPKDNPYIKFNSNDLHYAEKSVYGAFASAHPQYKEALDLILSKKIDARKLVTHSFKLEEFARALEIIKSGEALKVVIIP